MIEVAFVSRVMPHERIIAEFIDRRRAMGRQGLVSVRKVQTSEKNSLGVFFLEGENSACNATLINDLQGFFLGKMRGEVTQFAFSSDAA